MKDIASAIHQGIYGKSDKANAPGNQNEDFQLGFRIGSQSDGMVHLNSEFKNCGEPEMNSPEFARFREWKRGFWAGRMQKVTA